MDQNTNFIEIFTQFGFKDFEAKTYLATLSSGQSTARIISEKSGITRTFTYEILEELAQKGIVSSVEIRGKKHYSAISLDKLKALQKDKIKKFESVIPQLKMLEHFSAEKPKVSFYEGKEGIFTAQSDTLEIPSGSELLAFSTGEGLYHDDPQFALQYIKRRVKRKIFVRSIAPDNPETRVFSTKNIEHLRETRLVSPEIYPFANEIDIYGNKVAIINLIGELMAVIIESESVSRTMRSIFELSWKGAKK